MTALLLAAALAAVTQDDARVGELIRRLDESDFQARDEAFRDIVKLGPKTLPALRAARDGDPSPEVRLRAAEAIRAIELAEKAAQVCPEAPRITAEFADAELGDVLAEIARHAKLTLEGGLGRAGERRVSLSLKEATVFEALDRACAGQPDVTYEMREGGAIGLSSERHPACPTDYDGPFRVRLTGLTVSRRTDFKETSATAIATLAADLEPQLKPLPRPRYELSKAVDDAGTELQVTRGDSGDNLPLAGRAVVRIGRDGGDASRVFSLTGIGAGTTSLRLLKGSVTFSFALEHTIVSFKAPAANDRQEAGDFAFRIQRVAARLAEIEVTRARGGEGLGQGDVEARLDLGSFVLVDAEGEERKADAVQPAGSHVVVIGAGAPPQRSIRYRVMFGVAVQGARELRFQFIEKTLDRTVGFEFRDVKLP